MRGSAVQVRGFPQAIPQTPGTPCQGLIRHIMNTPLRGLGHRGGYIYIYVRLGRISEGLRPLPPAPTAKSKQLKKLIADWRIGDNWK